jgi:hypothetical protein
MNPPACDPAGFSSFVAVSLNRAEEPLKVMAEIDRLRTRIRGVNGLYVDGDRSRIHVLYDG